MLSKDLERIEREETLRNDADVRRQQQQAQGTTFHQRAVAEANQDLGRYGVAMGKPQVTGSAPIVRYTQASGPWQGPDPVGDEPPLGFDINALEPIENPAVVSPVSPAAATDAPAGAAASSDKLPPAQDQSGDAGASFSSDQANEGSS
jgi:hypothetical protein